MNPTSGNSSLPNSFKTCCLSKFCKKNIFISHSSENKEIAEVPSEATSHIPQDEEILDTEEALLDVSRDFLIYAAKAFSEESGLDRLLEHINSSIIDETKADGGAILLLDDFDDVIGVKAFKGTFPPPYCIPADIPHKIVRVETNFRFAQFGLDDNILKYSFL